MTIYTITEDFPKKEKSSSMHDFQTQRLATTIRPRMGLQTVGVGK